MDTPTCKQRFPQPDKRPLAQGPCEPDNPPRLSGKLNNGLKQKLTSLYQIGQDWLYLALLGTTMAVLSFSMDQVINLFLNTRLWVFEDLANSNLVARYLAWSTTPLVLVIFSTGFVHLCSPTVSLTIHLSCYYGSPKDRLINFKFHSSTTRLLARVYQR